MACNNYIFRFVLIVEARRLNSNSLMTMSEMHLVVFPRSFIGLVVMTPA